MNYKGIDIPLGSAPELDPGFIPMAAWLRAYDKAQSPLAVSVERENGQSLVYDGAVFGSPALAEADLFHVERLVKLLLWVSGGARVTIYGNDEIARQIRDIYSPRGARRFDREFMERVYERGFEVISLPYSEKRDSHETPERMSKSFSGCRIGFDAGGSDRKVSAVVDGEAVYSEEVVWHPKTEPNPHYHYDGIVSALKTAASKMERVDAIGVSSAGVYVANRTMVASLFLKVPPEDFDKYVKDIYIRAAREIGDVPLVVANDGDVTALAGSMELGRGNLLGIAMGTSLAGGYVNADGRITGRLNELAFAPVDLQPGGAVDEWSGDSGCGVKYMSQDAVALLAPKAGIELPGGLSPAEKLSFVQGLAAEGDGRALKVFETVGCYLGHGLAGFHRVYRMGDVMLLGRVMSGAGGEAVYRVASRIVAQEYGGAFNMYMPDEKSRRVGQSVAAACLP